ncbi:MAG TPA: AzlD domain-containing protein [Acidimicrobiales bacterium]|nr:AzlD domain-containing protein [Acidimicrobiales bacterium]
MNDWIVLGATSVLCLAVKLLGHFAPERWFAHPRLQRVNALIPISLLSALVMSEAFVVKTRVVIDHRAAGVAVAFAALLAKLPFPVVVASAAVTSALVVHFH